MKKIARFFRRIPSGYRNLKQNKPGKLIDIVLVLLVLSLALNVFILAWGKGKTTLVTANPVPIAADPTDLSIGQKIFTYTDRQIGVRFKYRAAETRDSFVTLIADNPSKGFVNEYLEVLTFDNDVQAALGYEIVTQSLELAGRDAFILTSKDGDIQDAYVLTELPEPVTTDLATGWVISIHVDRESLGPLISSFEFI